MSQSNNGYIIITTTFILGVIILLLTISAGGMIFFNRHDVLDAIFKERGYFLARSCIEHALEKLAENSSYTGNETITIDGSDQCQVRAIQSVPPNKTIQTTAVVLNITTNLSLTIDGNLNTVSYREQ